MNCPLCESNDVHAIIRTDEAGRTVHGTFHFVFGVKILRCNACDFVFADYIHPDVVDFYYRKMCRKDMSQDDLKVLRESSHKNGLSQLRSLEPYLPESLGTVLDFGGGAGEAARLYVDRVDKVYISEKDDTYVKALKADPNLQFVEDDVLDNDKYAGFFDLIIHSNTLEHLQNPVYQLARLSKIIKTDGLLFIEIPDEAETAAAYNFYGRQHILFFSLDTARLLVEKQGSFDIVDIRACGQSLSDLKKDWVVKWDYDKLQTDDGRVLRLVLKNTRPSETVVAPVVEAEQLTAAHSTLSTNLFEMSEIIDRH
jgi:2-polyprenyl-3-methyl-5-hydroxy-6-metoxy-1,4-benzoquinol methylase